MQGDFVIQVRPEMDLEQGTLTGRIEHMDSGHSMRFRTVQELVSFIREHAQPQNESPAEQDVSGAFRTPRDLTKP